MAKLEVVNIFSFVWLHPWLWHHFYIERCVSFCSSSSSFTKFPAQLCCWVPASVWIMREPEGLSSPRKTPELHWKQYELKFELVPCVIIIISPEFSIQMTFQPLQYKKNLHSHHQHIGAADISWSDLKNKPLEAWISQMSLFLSFYLTISWQNGKTEKH